MTPTIVAAVAVVAAMATSAPVSAATRRTGAGASARPGAASVRPYRIYQKINGFKVVTRLS